MPASIEEAVGGMHGRDDNSVSDTMFVSQLPRECNIDQFCRDFE